MSSEPSSDILGSAYEHVASCQPVQAFVAGGMNEGREDVEWRQQLVDTVELQLGDIADRRHDAALVGT